MYAHKYVKVDMYIRAVVITAPIGSGASPIPRAPANNPPSRNASLFLRSTCTLLIALAYACFGCRALRCALYLDRYERLPPLRHGYYYFFFTEQSEGRVALLMA